MTLRQRLRDWLWRNEADTVKIVRKYLVVRQWYDTGNVTSEVIAAASKQAAYRLATASLRDFRTRWDIMNIIELD